MYSKKLYYDMCNGIAEVQKLLNSHGYSCTVDGKFGDITERKVKQFQSANGLAVDGIVGPVTMGELRKPMKVVNFKPREFYCKCGNCEGLPSEGVDNNLLQLLERIRAEVNNKYPAPTPRRIIIISGYRCPTHNKNEGGAKNSQHLYGKAADIKADGISAEQLGPICDRLNPNGGVGFGNNIVHVDTRSYRSRWKY